MPNIASAVKNEIIRVARKTVKGELEALRRASVGYRKDIAALKRAVSALERGRASLEKSSKTKASTAGEASEAEGHGGRTRVTAKGLRALRAKLGLSAHDFGRLAGATGQSIYNWEQGKNEPRAQQAQKLAALRSLGKREARARLEALPQ